jgi:hypothetical protein
MEGLANRTGQYAWPHVAAVLCQLISFPKQGLSGPLAASLARYQAEVCPAVR